MVCIEEFCKKEESRKLTGDHAGGMEIRNSEEKVSDTSGRKAEGKRKENAESWNRDKTGEGGTMNGEGEIVESEEIRKA